jgi:hypothetical protein
MAGNGDMLYVFHENMSFIFVATFATNDKIGVTHFDATSFKSGKNEDF